MKIKHRVQKNAGELYYEEGNHKKGLHDTSDSDYNDKGGTA